MKTIYPPKPFKTFNEWSKYIAEQIQPPKGEKKNQKKNDKTHCRLK